MYTTAAPAHKQNQSTDEWWEVLMSESVPLYEPQATVSSPPSPRHGSRKPMKKMTTKEEEEKNTSNIESINALLDKMQEAHCDIIQDNNIKQAYADNPRYRLAIKLFNEFDHTKTQLSQQQQLDIDEKRAIKASMKAGTSGMFFGFL